MRDHARFQKGRADPQHTAVNAQKSPGGYLLIAHAVLHANDRSLFGERFAQRLNRGGGLRRFDREDDDVGEARSDLARMSDRAQGFGQAVAGARFDEKPAAIDGGGVSMSGDQNYFRAALGQISANEAADSSCSVNDESHQISLAR